MTSFESYLPQIKTVPDADVEIRKLEAQLFPLRTYRNSLLPVNRLPGDVLLQIMRDVQQDEVAEVDTKYHWIRITQVCKYWRDVAMDCSVLWGTILIQSPNINLKWIKELCKLSRSAPISLVRIISNNHLLPGDSAAAQKQRTSELRLQAILRGLLHRIRAFEYKGRGGRGHGLLPSFDIAALSLESLVVVSSLDERFKLPGSILGSRVPSLRRLHLHHCEFSWDTPLFSHTIQDLKITSPLKLIEVDHLGALLSSLPHLRNLALGQVFSPVRGDIDWGSITPGHGTNHLPSIQSIIFGTDFFSTTAFFLSGICFPHLTQMQLFPKGNSQEFFGRVVLPILMPHVESSFKQSGMKLSVVERESKAGQRHNWIAFTFSTASSDQFWFEVCAYYDHGQYWNLRSMVAGPDIPASVMKEFTIGGRTELETALFWKLSDGPKLDTLYLIGVKFDALEFVKFLVDNVPQCDNHKLISSRCPPAMRRFRDGSLDGDSTLGDPDFDEVYEDGREEGKDDSHNEGVHIDTDGGGDADDGEVDKDDSGPSSSIGIDEPEQGGSYACTPCEECGRRWKSFFPALRRLVIRDVNLKTWLKVNEYRKGMHPIVQFIIRRIRCGVGIEEIIFETRQERWLALEEDIRLQLYHFCGDHSPSVEVRHFTPPPDW